MHAKSLQSCPILCDPVDCSPTSFSVHLILQARILEWVATSSSRGSSQPRDQTGVPYVSCNSRGFFTTSATLYTSGSRYNSGSLSSARVQPPYRTSQDKPFDNLIKTIKLSLQKNMHVGVNTKIHVSSIWCVGVSWVSSKQLKNPCFLRLNGGISLRTSLEIFLLSGFCETREQRAGWL